MESLTDNKEIKLLEEAIYKFPQVLANLKSESAINFVNSYLPYSTGFEIECNALPSFNQKDFQSIDNLMDFSGGDGEVRFIIPNGIKGLICLYNICEKLLTNCSLNMCSGIHYHIDMTDKAHEVFNIDFINKHNDYIINELKKWNTAKEINSNTKCFLDSRGWVNFQSGFKTMEIRIGEMSFDYNVIVTRIIDGNRIAKYIKGQTSSFEKLKNVQKQLKTFSDEAKKEIESLNLLSYREIIKNRIIKI